MDLKHKRTVEIYENAWHSSSYMSRSSLDFVDSLCNLYFPDDKLERSSNFLALDAGCGAGLFGCSFFRRFPNLSQVTFLDASSAVEVAEKYIPKGIFNKEVFRQESLEDHLAEMRGYYDVILSCGVIHHTSDPYLSFRRLVGGLKPNGWLYLWVYAETNEFRTLTDDLIRSRLNQPGVDEVKILDEITELAEILYNVHGEVVIERDLTSLCISSGRYSVQEFFHLYFLKAFHNPNFKRERNYLQNLDWFTPPLAKKFSKTELIELAGETGLNIQHLFQPTRSGFSLIGYKKG